MEPGHPAGVEAPTERVAVLAGVLVVAVAWLAGVAALDGRAPSTVVWLLAAAFVPYLGLTRAPLPPRWTRALGIGAGLALVLAPPILSDDVWRYLWDARVLSRGIDPYCCAPDDPTLEPLRSDVWEHVSNRDVPTIYPPIAQMFFSLARFISEAPWSMKLVALALHLTTGEVLLRYASDRRAHALFVLSPLALAESALSGHVDTAVGLMVLAAVSFAQPLGTGVLVALATGTKLVGLVLLPLLRRRPRELAVAAALSLVLVSPLASAGHASAGSAPGAAHYARRWRGNAAVYAFLESGVLATLSGVASARGDPPRLLRVPGAAWLSEQAAGSVLDPHADTFAGEPPADRDFVTRGVAAGMLTRALVLLMALAFAAYRLRGIEPTREVRDVLLFVLLVTPQLHPWYLLWTLPVELMSGGVAVRAWSFVVLLAYAPLDRWASEGVWEELPFGALAQLVVVVLALGWERRTRAGRLWTWPKPRGTPAALSER